MVDCSPDTWKAGICPSAAGFKSEGTSVVPAGLDPGAVVLTLNGHQNSNERVVLAFFISVSVRIKDVDKGGGVKQKQVLLREN